MAEDSRSPSLVGETLMDTESEAPQAPPSTMVGQQIGRYVVLHEVGSGAMGVVYGAYDPELDRKVALKLLHVHGVGADDKRRVRLQREAQAMARVSHPNVVTVHDVGTHEGDVFLAMEFIEGATLSEWLASEPREWPSVVEVFARAGEGLAAAHAAGLVHRDFKPDNVLVGEGGKVRVLDFGLVRAEGEEEAPATEEETKTTLSMSAELTRTGALMGTPAYMSPEQFARLPADARSDQFSFCAAFYEGLYGLRPFTGPTLAALATEVASGEVRPPENDPGVPGWLNRLVVRGLRPDPDERWASMRQLLDALEDGRKGRRGWLRIVAGIAAGAVLAGGAAWTFAGETRSAALCSGADAPISASWSSERRDAVREALTSASAAFGDEAWASAETQLDTYAEAWVQQRKEACEATNVAGVQSDQLLDLRMICLDRRLAGFDAVVSTLAEADREVAQRTSNLLSGLEPLEACADSERLLRGPQPADDPATREKIENAYADLAKGRAASDAGRYAAAVELGKIVVARTDEVEVDPVNAIARLFLANSLAKAGEVDAAAEAYDEAIAAALRQEARHLLAEGLIEQASHQGFAMAKPEVGSQLLVYAAGALDGIEVEPRTKARLENVTGMIAYGQGDYDTAIVHFERVHDLHQEIWGPEHPRTADILNNLGAIAFQKGDYEGSRAYHQRTHAIWLAAYGPDHPDVAVALNNLGTLGDATGDYLSAVKLFEQSLEIRRAALGAEHPAVAMSEFNLGISYEGLGRLDESIASHERALASWEASLGKEHPKVAASLTGLARTLLAAGRLEEARSHAERGLEIRTRAEVDAFDRAESQFVLAKVLHTQGRERRRARELVEVARKVFYEFGEAGTDELAETDALLAEISGAANAKATDEVR